MEQRNNDGILFRNNRKEKPNQPDYTGRCTVNGVEMNISAWVKTSQKGTTFLSMAFSTPQAESGQQAPQPAQAPHDPEQNPVQQGNTAGGNDNNDPLPF